MSKIRFVLMLSSVVLSSMAQAGAMGEKALTSQWRWVGGLSAGAAWTRAGTSQSFYLTPDIEKNYDAYKENNALALGDLFFGGQKSFARGWSAQLGLALGLSGNAKAQGTIWDDADPEFINHNYAYKIIHGSVAVKGKVLKDYGRWLTPWISGSIGVGLNRAYRFNNTPLIFEALVNPDFHGKTNAAFSYTVGAGVQKNINDHWQMGLGYEFSDWGKSQLGLADGQILNGGLVLNHVYTNGLLVNVTYVL